MKIGEIFSGKDEQYINEKYKKFIGKARTEGSTRGNRCQKIYWMATCAQLSIFLRDFTSPA
ncbi:hypothetical protein UABAM_01730 [Candidatus Uabimicrobium amorphum]|uniref:Uncharacterized protein n=1 Tax=Uabimicrobium amorphum TaxID=2596890 RepID=A0A5S9F2F4_UABAM|nr:hypothetical protein UABAM_01730 [Candidatus Uabimicrobium amorphum]